MHDKLYLPGLMKLKRLVDGGFFGRILSVRGEFGYWVFEGDYLPAQRPSWNYRAQDGGGMVLDMFCHWNYVLENLFGRVEAVTAKAVTHIPERWDERGERYAATADDAAYAIFELEGDVIAQVNSSWAVRVERKELVEFQVDGTHGSAVAGLFGCRIQPREATPEAGVEPRPAHRPRTSAPSGRRCPTTRSSATGSARSGSSSCSTSTHGRPHPYDFAAGVRGLRLVEAGLQSSRRGPAGGAVTVSATRRTLGTVPRDARPRADGGTDTVGPARAARVGRAPAPVPRAGSPSPRRTWWPTRTARTCPARRRSLDWESTLAFRRHLFRYGFGVAEAMDTAQRNMGLDWPAVQELVRRSAEQAREHGARIAAGAGTDHAGRADHVPSRSRDAYAEQVAFVEGTRRPGDRDGLAPPRGRRRGTPTTTSRCTATSSARCASR